MHDPMKRDAKILVFINNDERELRVERPSHPAVRLNQSQAQQHHIVEVDHPALSQQALVFGDERCKRFVLLPIGGVPI